MMKCIHRLTKDTCTASWATPYDEIFQCKTRRKECPRFEKDENKDLLLNQERSEHEKGTNRG